VFLLIWSLVKFLKSIGFLGVPLNMKHYSIPLAVEPFVVTGFLLLLLLLFFFVFRVILGVEPLPCES